MDRKNRGVKEFSAKLDIGEERDTERGIQRERERVGGEREREREKEKERERER